MRATSARARTSASSPKAGAAASSKTAKAAKSARIRMSDERASPPQACGGDTPDMRGKASIWLDRPMAEHIVTGVDFTPIPTRDIEKAVHFYGEVLGLPRAVYMPERNFAEFEPGDVTINVYNPEKMGVGEHQPNANPLALHVEDVPAARAERGARGGAGRARVARRRVPRRHVRPRGLPHGVLSRSGREPVDAPPSLRPAEDRA